jgi:hypothetical protein
MSDTDIFREVEEDLQRERFEKFWKQHGNKIIGAVALILVGFGGYRLWDNYRAGQAAVAGVKLVAAADLQRDGKGTEAKAAFEALAADAPGSYRVLARLRLAADLAAASKTDEAVAAYDSIGKDSGVDLTLKEFAQVQAAQLRLDKAELAEMETRLNPLTTGDNPWRHSARELLGLASLKAGKFSVADGQFQQILADRSSPQGLLKRAQIVLQVIEANTAVNATVEPAAKKATDGTAPASAPATAPATTTATPAPAAATAAPAASTAAPAPAVTTPSPPTPAPAPEAPATGTAQPK